MLLGLTYQLIRFFTELILIRVRSDAQLRAEVLALRYELRVLERKVSKVARILRSQRNPAASLQPDHLAGASA